MKLIDYLAATGETAASFARRLGIHEASVSRVLAGSQIPRRDLMARIVEATGGAVTPNDFFDLPPAAAGAGAGGVINAPLARASDEAA